MSKTNPHRNGNQRAFMLLGFDAQFRPRGARFEGGEDTEQVLGLMRKLELNAYPATSRPLATAMKKLPRGTLEAASDEECVPVISPELYSALVVALVADPQQAIEAEDRRYPLPPITNTPRDFESIKAGSRVIAKESRPDGWWEAVVLSRSEDMHWLRYREFRKLPKFPRPRRALAIPPAADRD
jgi:hypothetical protein